MLRDICFRVHSSLSSLVFCFAFCLVFCFEKLRSISSCRDEDDQSTALDEIITGIPNTRNELNNTVSDSGLHRKVVFKCKRELECGASQKNDMWSVCDKQTNRKTHETGAFEIILSLNKQTNGKSRKQKQRQTMTRFRSAIGTFSSCLGRRNNWMYLRICREEPFSVEKNTLILSEMNGDYCHFFK